MISLITHYFRRKRRIIKAQVYYALTSDSIECRSQRKEASVGNVSFTVLFLSSCQVPEEIIRFVRFTFLFPVNI